jgi:hypothetical protein
LNPAFGNGELSFFEGFIDSFLGGGPAKKEPLEWNWNDWVDALTA